MAVDWSKWLDATPSERDEMLRRYREIVKAESDEARFNNYARVWAAVAGAKSQ